MCATDEESVRVVSSTLHSLFIRPCQVNKFFGRFGLPSGVRSVKRGFPQCLRLSKNLSVFVCSLLQPQAAVVPLCSYSFSFYRS